MISERQVLAALAAVKRADEVAELRRKADSLEHFGHTGASIPHTNLSANERMRIALEAACSISPCTEDGEPQFFIVEASRDEDTSRHNRINEVSKAAEIQMVGLGDEIDGGVIGYLIALKADEIIFKLNNSC